MKKRLLSMLMAVLMIASLVPATALAAGSTTYDEHATHDVLTVNIEKDTAKKQPGIVFEYCNTCGMAGQEAILTPLAITPFAAHKDICPAGHHTPFTKVLQAETCEKPKITVTYCSVCGSAVTPLGSDSALQITKSEKGGHTYSKFFVTKAPTCTEPGYGYTKCDKCGEALFVYGETQIASLMSQNQKTEPKTALIKANEKLFAATNPGHLASNDNIVTTDVDVKDYKLSDEPIGQNDAYTIEEYTKYYAAVKATHAETVNGMLVPNGQGGMDNEPIADDNNHKWDNWAFFYANGKPITGMGVVGSKYCKDCGVVVNTEADGVPGATVNSLNEQHAAFMTLKQGYIPYLDSQGHKIPGVTDTWYCSECEKTWGGTEIPYASYWGNETSKIPADCVDNMGLPNKDTTENYYVDGDLFTINKKAATCTELGYTGDVYKLVGGEWRLNAKGTKTPTLGHNMKAIDSKAPTCTEEGWTVSNFSVCTRCGATEGTSVVKADTVPHSMVAVDVIAPTCKSAGMTVLECSFCHKLAAAETSGDAAYIDGNGNYVTINEFADYYDIPLNQLGELVFVKTVKSVPHAAAAELKDAKEATCTEVGYTGDKVCKWCGIVMEKGKEIPMKEHTVVDVAAVEATCTEAGATAGTKCSVCGTVLSGCEKVDALGHKYENGVCTVCGEKDPNYVEPVAPEFKDADSIKDYAKDAVAWAAKEGVVKGDDQGNFNPTANITRQDFVTMLWRLNGEVASDKELTFGDKADIKDYAQVAVAWAVENGYITGRDNGNFDPAAKITRAEIVAILNRVADNAKAEKAASFTDIGSHWAKDAIAWAAEAGIVNGVGNDLFAPNDNATRQDTVVMLYKFVNLK